MVLAFPFRYGLGYIDNASEAMTNRKIQTACCDVWDSFGPLRYLSLSTLVEPYLQVRGGALVIS